MTTREEGTRKRMKREQLEFDRAEVEHLLLLLDKECAENKRLREAIASAEEKLESRKEKWATEIQYVLWKALNGVEES